MRGETIYALKTVCLSEHFNPLPSCEGRQSSRVTYSADCTISIHSPHARGDTLIGAWALSEDYFNPLPSCEGRQYWSFLLRCPIKFQSTPLMRGETFRRFYPFIAIPFQSTPLMRGETHTGYRQRRKKPYFNPLPSCEGRLPLSTMPRETHLFQSTPLMRGETA